MELLVNMIFMHFLFDYYIQSRSNVNIKDKIWWKKRHPNNKKKVFLSYTFGLLMHSFVWSYAVLFPFYYKNGSMSFILLSLNTAIHAMVDNCKTNKKCISSIQDQVLHLIQVTITFLILHFMF